MPVGAVRNTGRGHWIEAGTVFNLKATTNINKNSSSNGSNNYSNDGNGKVAH